MLRTPLKDILSTTAYHLKKLDSMGIKIVQDLLYYFPRAYEDRSHVTGIRSMTTEGSNVISGKILTIEKRKSKQGMPYVHALLEDQEGEQCTVLWFRQTHIATQIREGDKVTLAGKATFKQGGFTMSNPSIERGQKTEEGSTTIIPIYPEADKLSSDWFRLKIKGLLYCTKDISDHLPEEVRKEHKLLELSQALKEIHQPTSTGRLEQARYRLGFDEVLVLQCISLLRRYKLQQAGKGNAKAMPLRTEVVKEFLAPLPFQLTDAQKIALYEALRDMEKPEPMLRLLQGDVGSGKTVVATALWHHTIRHGHQGAMMVPTEVLARQHYEHIAPMLAQYGMHVALLTGSVPQSKKKEIYLGLKQGTIDAVVGTHALIQQGVGFRSLGIVVIDEQHRFGVEQRNTLAAHGYPHVLQMTATPIPRTLTMTMYGDHDVSVINELPKGRKPIITKVVHPRDRQKMYLFLRTYINQGRQVYVICPLVEESENLQVKAATEEYHLLAQELFPDLRVALLHGKMAPKEKQEVMAAFKEHQYDILVSTSVIEVGINVPNATIIVIEGAERFGLSQLHQFRGRVGRGEHQSYCILATTDEEQRRSRKLKAMEQSTDGFVLAQIDLELRGPGEVFGLRQSGLGDFKIATMSDTTMIKHARDAALALLEKDPTLQSWPALAQKIALKLEGLEALTL